MSLSPRDAWIALASVNGVGDETFGLLLASLGDPAAVLAAALDGRLEGWLRDRRAATGRPAMRVDAVAALKATARDPATRLSEIESEGLWTFTPLDAAYPPRLRDLPEPPAVLHGLGRAEALTGDRIVSIVGTRRPTPAGRELAARVAARLVEAGATVVSGLAIGIDGAAHGATIERGGTTVGVIGAGHRSPGPRAHARLRQDVVDSSGAIVSEHHPSTHATLGTYPRRNRIIAALAEATVVIEAPRKSGALITARHALDLGRAVFVAPGRVGDWSMAGSLTLLRDSPARPLTGLDELIEDLGYLAGPRGATAEPTVSRDAALGMLGGAERSVAEVLCQAPAGLDLLVTRTGLAPGVVSGAVTLLLMRGWIQSHGAAFVTAGPLLA